MEEAGASQYWCHMCLQVVNPIMEVDTIKCPICQSGFVEERSSAAATGNNDGPLDFVIGGSDSDRALSLWAPILLGMMSNPRRHRRIRHMELEEDDNEASNNADNRQHHDRETELDRELDSIIRRRRRSSAAILQLLQGIRAGLLSESGNSESGNRDNDRDRERVILINPFNQTIIVQGSSDPSNDSLNRAPVGSLGDYFIGPGLDLLLHHLSENDPNRHGTPPAKKEVVEALPTVEVEETLQCSVCLEDCEIGTEVKEMPCKHKFHSGCILPWLELHSSCPICRYQLPCDDTKHEVEGSRNNNNNNNDGSSNNGENGGGNGNDIGRQFQVPLPWPFSSLFSPLSPSSRSGSGNLSTASASEPPPTDGPPSASREDEN